MENRLKSIVYRDVDNKSITQLVFIFVLIPEHPLCSDWRSGRVASSRLVDFTMTSRCSVRHQTAIGQRAAAGRRDVQGVLRLRTGAHQGGHDLRRIPRRRRRQLLGRLRWSPRLFRRRWDRKTNHFSFFPKWLRKKITLVGRVCR